MPYGSLPPSSIWEALAQAMSEQTPQDSLANLLSGSVPTGHPGYSGAPTGSPFPESPAGSLTPLEAQLSDAANAKSGIEEAAYLGNRPDIFLNQAMDRPEMAPILAEKATATSRRAASEEQSRQFDVQQGEQAFQEHTRLAGEIGKDLGDYELGADMARKMMSGQVGHEDYVRMAAAKYGQELRDFKTKKDFAKTTAMHQYSQQFKINEPDPVTGQPHLIPPDLSRNAKGEYNNPKHGAQYEASMAEQDALLDQQFGPGPTPPSALLSGEFESSQPGTVQQRQVQVEVRDPKTGKKTTKWVNQATNVAGPTEPSKPTQPYSDKLTSEIGAGATKKETPAPTGSLKSQIEEFKKPVEEAFMGGMRSLTSPQETKQLQGKQIAMQIIQAGVRAGKQPQQIIEMAKADSAIPPEIQKLIEQYAMRF